MSRCGTLDVDLEEERFEQTIYEVSASSEKHEKIGSSNVCCKTGQDISDLNVTVMEDHEQIRNKRAGWQTIREPGMAFCTCAICGYTKGLTLDYSQWPKLVGASSEFYPVTEKGYPGNDLVGLICARCLNRANSMRSYIKGLLSKLVVAKHAVERFMMRSNDNQMNEEAAKVTIMKLFNQARPIRFKDKYMVLRILNNHFREARYYYAQGFIFVLTAEFPPTILTVERTGDKKLGRDFFYIEN